jgi:hypothetical protein
MYPETRVINFRGTPQLLAQSGYPLIQLSGDSPDHSPHMTQSPQEILDYLYWLLGPRTVLLAIPLGEKGPRSNGWQNRTFAESRNSENYRALIRAADRNGNIGAQLGPFSDNLVTIDIDTDEELEYFRVAVPWVLETTQSRGRNGCQIWLHIQGPYPTCRVLSGLKIPGTNKSAIEWRGGGGHQSVIFGQHPDRAPDGNVIRYRRIIAKPAIILRFTDIPWPTHWLMPFTKEPPYIAEPFVTSAADHDGAIIQGGSNPIAIAWPPVPLTTEDERYVLHYLDKIPDAIQGQWGSKPTFRVATILVHGFNFDFGAARRFFEPFNQRSKPPWSEREIQHKFTQARIKWHPKPAGHLWVERRLKPRRELTNQAHTAMKIKLRDALSYRSGFLERR